MEHYVSMLGAAGFNGSLGNATLNSPEVVGGAKYIRENPLLCIPYLIIVSLTLAVGTGGNLLLICAIFCSKQLRNPGNLLVVNLAIGDAFVATLSNGFTLIGMVVGERFFLEHPSLCYFAGAACLSSCVCSFFTQPMVAFNRYIKICHLKLYNSVFTQRNTIAMCVCIWLVALLMQAVTISNWGIYEYDRKALACFISRFSHVSYTIFQSATYIILPGLISALCYTRIYFAVRSSKRRVHVINDRDHHRHDHHGVDVSLTVTLFVCWVAYFVLWSPYSLLFVWDHWDHLPQWPFLYSVAFGHANSMVNPILYGATNKAFRQGYLTVLRLDKCTKHGSPEVTAANTHTHEHRMHSNYDVS